MSKEENIVCKLLRNENGDVIGEECISGKSKKDKVRLTTEKYSQAQSKQRALTQIKEINKLETKALEKTPLNEELKKNACGRYGLQEINADMRPLSCPKGYTGYKYNYSDKCRNLKTEISPIGDPIVEMRNANILFCSPNKLDSNPNAKVYPASKFKEIRNKPKS